MREPVVVDTNVLLVANGSSSYSRACQAACAKRLSEIKESGAVVLDLGREILKEYCAKQPSSGQPGVGAEFLKWILNTKQTVDHCIWLKINEHDDRIYEEFPDHAELVTFDRSDRKFVAVAVAHGSDPPIMQAADSKWWGWKDALGECGVTVDFLCPSEIEDRYKQKMNDG